MIRRPTMPPDPVRLRELSRHGARLTADESFHDLVTAPSPAVSTGGPVRRSSSRRPLVLGPAAVVVALAVVVPLALSGSSGLSHATTTTFHAGHAFVPRPKGKEPQIADGRWQLLSAIS